MNLEKEIAIQTNQHLVHKIALANIKKGLAEMNEGLNGVLKGVKTKMPDSFAMKGTPQELREKFATLNKEI